MLLLKYGLIVCLLLFAISKTSTAQKKNIDSLQKEIAKNRNDTGYINSINDLAFAYIFSYPDSSYHYANRALLLSDSLNYQSGIIMSKENIGFSMTVFGNYPKALSIFFEALKLSENNNYDKGKEFALTGISNVYSFQNDHLKSIEYTKKAIETGKLIKDDYSVRFNTTNLSIAYLNMDMLDSATYYITDLYNQFILLKDSSGIANCLSISGAINSKNGNYNLALRKLKEASAILFAIDHEYEISTVYREIAKVFQSQKKNDSALHYAMTSLYTTQKIGFISGEISTTEFLSQFFKKINKADSALKYLELNVILKDSAFNQEKNKAIQNMIFEENLRQQQILQAKKQAEDEYKSKLKTLVFLLLFWLLQYFLL